MLAKYLVDSEASQVLGRRVIELGAGCGLAGIVAAKLGASETCITDQAALLGLISHNIKVNCSNLPGVRAIDFSWGEATTKLHPPYDFVLVADCINPIYGYESWERLATSVILSPFISLSFFSPRHLPLFSRRMPRIYSHNNMLLFRPSRYGSCQVLQV